MTVQAEIPPWDVAMLGPSRVGKTSLLTALRVAANTAFADTNVIMEPADDTTRRAFANNDNLMRGELAAGRFRPDSLPGNLEEAIYAMAIETGVASHRLSLRFHDYPGGWLDERPERVASILADCPTVILPVDATLVMESGQPHKPDVVAMLELAQIAEFVDKWATTRRRNHDPAWLVVAPVKCESYFTDNGGRVDRADSLFREVGDLFRETVDAFRSRTAPDADVLYAPVDTIGPIEIMDVEWAKDEQGKWRMTQTYRVRRNPNGQRAQRRVLGAEPILADLVKSVIHTQEEALRAVESDLDEERRRRSGWFRRLVDNISGRTDERRRAVAGIRSDLSRLADETGHLGSKEYGRVRSWT